MKTIIFAIMIILSPLDVNASLSSDLSGRILLDIENHGEAWYVYPEDMKRYYLGRPSDAFQVMRELGLGISELDFQKIAQADMPVPGDIDLARRLSGKIIIQTEKNGEAWYVNGQNLKKYYLGRPDDAFRIMRELGLGITRDNLARIHKPGLEEGIDAYSKYEHKKIALASGEFAVDLVTIDARNPNLKIITAAANKADCDARCNARSLGDFVFAKNAFAGINGTYFEAYDAEKLNYYFYPVYDTTTDVLINADQLKYWTTGPIFLWDENNKFYYFKDSRELGNVAQFQEKYGVKIQAAIGNRPRLIENGMNLLIEWDIDAKQRDVKAARNAIGIKGDLIYLVVAQQATLPELADIMKVLEAEYALNLDGGYSAALLYNGEYMVGPGRNIPNAIMFAQ